MSINPNVSEYAMNNNAFNSKPIKTTPGQDASDALRDLIAAMPIVIFARAVRAALQRPTGAPASLRVAESN